MCSIPFKDGFFDEVVAFDVLEHIEDDGKAVQEIRRVLKDNGSLIFTVPAFNFLFSSHDRALNHFRRYNTHMIHHLLRNFTRIYVSFWVFSLFIPVALQRMVKKNEANPRVHYSSLPAFINAIFYKILTIENWLIQKGVSLPFGTTLCGVYKKVSL